MDTSNSPRDIFADHLWLEGQYLYFPGKTDFDAAKHPEDLASFLSKTHALSTDRLAIEHSILQQPQASPPVYFDFIDDERINARMLVTPEVEFIGMYWGSLVILRDVFFRMLSHPLILPWIGDSSRESLPDSNFQALPKSFSELRPFYPGPMPKDATRRHYAAALLGTALQFLLLHEYGHLLKGHGRLRKAPAKSFGFDEIVWTPEDGVTPMVA